MGDLILASGALMRGQSVGATVPTAVSGARLVKAMLGASASYPNRGSCPASAPYLVQMIFQGGETGVRGAPLGKTQRTRTIVTLRDAYGRAITMNPVALGDDLDGPGYVDNYIHACVSVPAGFVHVEGQVFVYEHTYFDLANRPNVRSAMNF